MAALLNMNFENIPQGAILHYTFKIFKMEPVAILKINSRDEKPTIQHPKPEKRGAVVEGVVTVGTALIIYRYQDRTTLQVT